MMMMTTALLSSLNFQVDHERAGMQCGYICMQSTQTSPFLSLTYLLSLSLSLSLSESQWIERRKGNKNKGNASRDSSSLSLSLLAIA